MPVDLSMIMGALQQFGQSNRTYADRQMQAQNRRAGQIGTAGAAVGGVIGGVYGGPAGASAGAAVGGLVGRAAGGGEVGAGDIAQAGATAYGAYQTGKQQEAQQNMAQGMFGPALDKTNAQNTDIQNYNTSVAQGSIAKDQRASALEQKADATTDPVMRSALQKEAAEIRQSTAGDDAELKRSMGVLSQGQHRAAAIKGMLANSGHLSPQDMGILAQQMTPQVHERAPGSGQTIASPFDLRTAGGSTTEPGSVHVFSDAEAKKAGLDPAMGKYSAMMQDGKLVSEPKLFKETPAALQKWITVARNAVEEDPKLAALDDETKDRLVRTMASRSVQAEAGKSSVIPNPQGGEPFVQEGADIPGVMNQVMGQYRGALESPADSSTGPGVLSQPLPEKAGRAVNRPVPRDEAKSTESAITMMGELTKFSANLGETGLIKGNVNKMLNLAGWGSPESRQNESIEPNLVRLGNEIFGKRITNFDLTRIDAMIPHVGAPQAVNEARIQTISDILRPAIANDIQRYKQAKLVLTDQMLKYADAVGLNPDKITKADLKAPKYDQADWNAGKKLNPRTGSGDGGKFMTKEEMRAGVKVGEYYIDLDGKIAKRGE